MFTTSVVIFLSGLEVSSAEINGKFFSSPFKPVPVSKSECEKMKSTYGIKYCFYEQDYWAGAVKQCGGIAYMPSASDLIYIANYIYSGNFEAKSNVDDLTYLFGTASILGLPEPVFALWSADEDVSDPPIFGNGFNRIYMQNHSYWASSTRCDQAIKAICVR